MKMNSSTSGMLLFVIVSVQGMFTTTISEKLLKHIWSSQQTYALPLIQHPLFDEKIAGDARTSICFDKTGRFLRYMFYKDSLQYIFIFNTGTGKTENRAKFIKDSSIQSMTFGFDYTNNPALLTWNYFENNTAFIQKHIPYSGTHFMSFYPGKNGITAGTHFELVCINNVYEGRDTLSLYDSDNLKILKIMRLEDKKISRLRTSICLSPDNTIMATLLHDGSIWLIHAKKPIIESVDRFHDIVVKCEQ